MAKKKKKQGHYCRICGKYKSNESFSGKGHTKHICKVCDALPQEKKNELQILNRIEQVGERYPKSRQDWELLEKYARNNRYPEAKELAIFFLEMRGKHVTTQNNKNEGVIFQGRNLLLDLDNEIREDIIAEMYEQIINYMYQKEKFPGEEQKQNTLNQIRDIIFVEHKALLSQNNDLDILYDRTQREVIEDIENDEF